MATWSAAEDLNPPGYRGLLNSTSAEWDFTGPAGVFFPDGSSVPLVVGNTGPVAPGSGVPFPFCVLFGGASWVGPPGGIAGAGTIACNIPNWHDNEPIKRQRVQVTYKGPKPSIREFCFLGVPGSSDLVTETLVAEVADTTLGLLGSGGSYFYQDWECRPNPDWEQVVVDIPSGTVIDQLVIDTISSSRRYPIAKITSTPPGSNIPTLITTPDQPYQVTIEVDNLDVGMVIAGSAITYNGINVTDLILGLSNVVRTPTGARIQLPPVSFPRDLTATLKVVLKVFVDNRVVEPSDELTILIPR